MNYTIENLKGEVKINFSLTAEEWENALNKAYLKNKAKFNVPGFRKGHATRKMIEKMYGEGVFFDEAFNQAFYESYSKALDEHEEIFPVDEPKVDIDDIGKEGVSFHAIVTVKPEVTLGEYKGIKIDKVEYNVTAEDVQAEIDRALKQGARRVEVTDRKVENGDIVNLDYSGSVDGVKFDGGTASGQELVIGSGSFIPGFEEQMVGMAIGETKDLNVKFPEQYHSADLAGKDAVFTVTVNKIEAEELPALDDEFAKNVSKFDTVAEYKADIEKNLKESKDRQADMENENAVIEAVTANATVEIPRCMIESQLDYLMQDMEYRLQYMYRMKLEDYLKYTGGTIEELRKSREADAERDVKTRLVLEAIVK
ncbi:MAG: trigger factor, partial [Clostridia bacterium]|nr:trigger factor [Clostridia bacterium]